MRKFTDYLPHTQALCPTLSLHLARQTGLGLLRSALKRFSTHIHVALRTRSKTYSTPWSTVLANAVLHLLGKVISTFILNTGSLVGGFQIVAILPNEEWKVDLRDAK